MGSPDNAPAEPLTGLVVLDIRGHVFDKIRRMELGRALWRTLRVPSASDVLTESTVLLVAAYEAPDWSEARVVARRFPTIIAAHPASSDDAIRSLRAGAIGYLDSELPIDAMRRALLGALQGESIYGRDVVGAWLRDGKSSVKTGVKGTERLTIRQREIVGLIARGATDKEIGAALGIRTATAQKHVANLLRRLGVPNRAAAVGRLWIERAEDQSPV